MPLYAVTVEIFCESPEEAVRKTIIAGSVDEAEVQDLGHQVQFPPIIKVAEREEDFLTL